jgi:glycosyltransferase involved in cell wall biosynthesis
MHILQRYIEQNTVNHPIGFGNLEIRASIFVVIPCYNEPDIETTLNSLSKCCPPKAGVAVLIVVNSSEDASDAALAQNLKTISSVSDWGQRNKDIFFEIHCLHVKELPRKFAGVGWARKIGMDEVIKQLYNTGQDDGILVSFDADSTVLPNYLQVIEQSFEKNPKCNFFTIDFAHSLQSIELSDLEREGIIRYELHMRYFRNAMEWSGYPHSIHTVGSSFAVRASAYAKQGGMNRKKAGEDFYFLHKLVLLGPYGNISSTTVFPAARISDRVPFGTGAALKKWSEGNPELMTTYAFDAFIYLRPFLENPAQFIALDATGMRVVFENYPSALKSYLLESGTIKEILELQANCSNSLTFTTRFFHRINAFWILKYLNFVHDKYLNRGDLYNESIRLLNRIGIDVGRDTTTSEQLLGIYRSLDKKYKNCS